MSFEAILTLAILILMILALVFEWSSPDYVSFTALALLIFSGVLRPGEALGGFSNQGLLTVAMLFPIAYGVKSTGLLEILADRLIGRAKPGRRSLFRMLLPVYALSTVLNNTPVVAMFIPTVRNWALRGNISPSKYLLPLSYASILGGVATLIGTSTNLLLDGMMRSAGLNGIGFLTVGYIGVPAAFFAFIYLGLRGYRLLPDNRDLLQRYGGDNRNFIFEFKVSRDASVSGKTVEQAALRNLEEIYLFAVIRNEEQINFIPPHFRILSNDVLVFSGKEKGLEKLQQVKGLLPMKKLHLLHTSSERDKDASDEKKSKSSGDEGVQLHEIVLSQQFPYIGKTVKEIGFRNAYNAVVIAIHRHGEELQQGIGGTSLQAGDTLLVLAGRSFLDRQRYSRDFYIIDSKESGFHMPDTRVYISIAFFFLALLASALNLITIFEGVLFSLVIMMGLKVISISEARKSIDLQVLIVIASTLGIGEAIRKSGLAGIISDLLQSNISILGPVGILALLYLITSVLTEFISNNAAAVLVFPIALELVSKHHFQIIPLAVAVAIAASASFATPMGYQTNLMVYGPGGYTTRDYLRLGLPLNLLVMLVTLILVPLIWDLQ